MANQSKFENYINPSTERQQLLSKMQTSLVHDIISEIENNDRVFENYTIFSNHLDKTLYENINNLSDEEYDVLLVAFEVMKKSYLYWSSPRQGGIGKGEAVIKNINVAFQKSSNNIFKKSNNSKVQRIIADDAMGVASAFIGNAFFWSGGPASYFGSVAFSSAMSSAMSSAWGN